MWSTYSARQASDFVGLSESVVRSCARDGLLNATGDFPLRVDFADLKVLKVVRDLSHRGVSLRRVRRQLATLSAQLPEGTSLGAVALDVHNGHVVVRDADRVWRADTGQLVFGFEFCEQQGLVRDLRRPGRRDGQEEPDPDDADDWFEHGLALEEADPTASEDAYRRVLELRPNCVDTLINLGRLCAEAARLREAEPFFARAIALEPKNSIALYNMGVVAQDMGRDREAIAHYLNALEGDSSLAEAHYNLATIYDRVHEGQAAIRHINEYRKLTRGQRR